MKLIRLTVLCLVFVIAKCQIINRAPQFVPGSGDMARFSLSENTPIGSPIYQLRGVDPEGGTLHYSISGPVFSVDRDTGVVRLRQQLDRETQDLVEVILSITDEGVLGTEPNTVSLRREIPIRDYNDNPPIFHGRPYSASISESTSLQTEILVNPRILVSDRDEGQNSDVNLSCFNDGNKDSDICDTFHVATEKLAEGNFTAIITLLKPLDFETRPSYLLTIMAKDGASSNALSAFATISINVIDIQDQPPVFLQAPYSVTIPENTPEETSILTISAIDGDTGNPRPILLTLESEQKGHFKLEPIGKPGDGKAILYTTNIPVDREDPDILQNGGVYTFSVKATELINNELPGDFTLTQVQVVLTDVDDHLPEFNELNFEIEIPENPENETPLPGLSIYVLDKDLGVNSRYNLSLKNVLSAENVFAVTPTRGEGRTPIVVKVTNSTMLDYDVHDHSLRTLIFDIVASVNDSELAKSRITVHLQDANDNAPVFTHQTYRPKVKENSAIGTKIADIIATDADNGKFGEVHYMLRGFGVEYFSTDRQTGGLYLKKSLDYEQQRSYSLSIVAVDGGGLETNANLYVDVIDLNDNSPHFESLEYTRTIREGAIDFEPQFFVRAIDVDGPSQGDGRIIYSIDSENSISGHVFAISSESGEIKIVSPVNSMDTERGQYELIIAATDYGIPPLKNTTRVLIRVGISGNQRPVFKGHFDPSENRHKPGPPKYKVSIPEIAPAGYNVTVVTASDPDGLDSLLTYRIVGANDNFVINEKTGLVTVAAVARLDRDTNPKSYSVVINAVDAGFPIPETATTTLTVNIDDVNDKPPKFIQQSYTVYVSEITPIHTDILTVAATDTDITSNISYSIIEPIKAASKTGIQLTSITPYDYRSSFSINATSGVITVKNSLNHDLAAVIRLTIKAVDLNAVYNKEEQFDTADVTIYIQSFKDTNPIFRNKGWTSSLPVVNVKVKEEMPIGMVLFTLLADDPVTNRKIQSFEMIENDPLGVFQLNDRTGEIMLKKRLDYEELISPIISFSVKARSIEGRFTLTNINVTVENVNDNSPEFDKKLYRATVMETAQYPTEILTVHATDKDAVLTDFDKLIGFTSVSYHLTGSNSGSFQIHNHSGVLQIAPGQTLDREKQSQIKLTISAEDSPGKPSEKRKSTTEIVIDVLDVNDNPPMFSQKTYSAVIPENSGLNSLVANISATDPDEGPGGEIRFELLNEGDANGLFKINPNNGEIRTKKSLTGKGRSEPYELVVRAQDNGDQLAKQKSLHSDVPFVLFIGDVSANDGIPIFVTPKVGQIANISENATIGSPVFQVLATDPDNPMTPSGTLRYKIQDDIEDASTFRIDPITGLIITVKSLDRETKSTFNMILEVSDNGEPPQASTRVLRINVLDVDDHKPRFIRDIDSQPLEITFQEEQPIGSYVGTLFAVDEDIDENGAIDYMFTDGNQEDIFKIYRTANNSAIITTLKKLDHEISSSYLLTVKCFQYGTKHSHISRGPYNNYDPSEIQIIVKVLDVDDHLPMFDVVDPVMGIRLNIPIDQSILTTQATDEDSDALPIDYSIHEIEFIPQFYKRDNSTPDNLLEYFTLNNKTGELRTRKSLADFVDGYFSIVIRANNSVSQKRFSDNKIKVFVMRDKSLLRFVFAKPVSDMLPVIDLFANEVQSRLNMSDIELYILDTQVLTKSDLSLDFSSTSSCFQLSRHGSALAPREMQSIMDSNDVRQQLLDVYAKYSVNVVESCSVKRNVAVASMISSPGTWLVILAVFIGLSAFIAACTACCLAKKYKRKSSRLIQSRIPPPESYTNGTPVLYAEPVYGPL